LGAPEKHEIETACINQLMAGGIYDLTVHREAMRGMRQIGVDLPDVHYVGSTGRVTSSGMRGNRGLWVVRGPTIDGIPIELTVSVVSTEYDVELLEVCSVKMRGK
jgi:hypothetical protein